MSCFNWNAHALASHRNSSLLPSSFLKELLMYRSERSVPKSGNYWMSDPSRAGLFIGNSPGCCCCCCCSTILHGRRIHRQWYDAGSIAASQSLLGIFFLSSLCQPHSQQEKEKKELLGSNISHWSAAGRSFLFHDVYARWFYISSLYSLLIFWEMFSLCTL